MREISAKELRSNLPAVLRRVEAGERLRVTVNGRPVAELAPLRARRTIPWETFIEGSEDWRADPESAKVLAELLTDTTDDVQIR